MRLDIERQKELEPKRFAYAIEKLQELGLIITDQVKGRIQFEFKGEIVTFYPYSGWFTGKTVKDGRGIELLLKQLK